MKAKWSPEDLLTLEQQLPQQGIQGASQHVGHTQRETYDQAIKMGYVPPNGLGPWPRRSKGSAWPASDEHVLRQEYLGPPSVPYIAGLLDRPVTEVEAMAITLGLAKDTSNELGAPTEPGAIAGPQRKKPKLTLASSQAEPVSAVDQDLDDLGEKYPSASVTAGIEFTQALELFKTWTSNLRVSGPDERIPTLPAPTRWTRSKDEYLIEHYHKLSVAEIAETLGMSYYQTTSRARRLNVSYRLSSWSREETIFLLEHIQTEPLPWVAEQLGRTMAAVSLRPKQLGIFPGWTGHDDQVLLQNLGKLTHEQIGKLIDRPAYAIDKRERFLRNEEFEFSRAGLSRLFASKGQEWVDGLIYLPVRPAQVGKRKWTKSEIEFLKKHYPKKGSIWCAAKLGIVAEKVRHKAQVLGVNSERAIVPWTAEDDQWLLDNVHKLDRLECARMLNRTKGAVSVRASVLGAFKQD